MIMMDSKKAVSSMMKKRKDALGNDIGSAPMKPELVRDTDGDIDPKHMACEDILMALHEKSAHKLKQALSNFHDLHSLDRESGSHDAPDDSESDFLA